MGEMLRKTLALTAFLAASFLIGCGTSSDGPDGSRHQAMTGVSPSGYPAGSPTDPGSPALASSTEQKYSRDQEEAPKAGEASKSAEAPAGESMMMMKKPAAEAPKK